MHRVVNEYTRQDTNSSTNINVYIRVRPLENPEEASDFLEMDMDDNTKISIKDPDVANRKYGEVSFQFDRLYWTETRQDQIFDEVCRTQAEHVLSGYNCCCLAYGQTGSGKTYSMFGEGDADKRGLIPRTVEYFFERFKSYPKNTEIAMVCSFLEIYNDQVRDLGRAYLVAIGQAEPDPSGLNERMTSDIFESLQGKRGNPNFAPAFLKKVSDLPPGNIHLKQVADEYHTMNYEIREDVEGRVFVKDLSLITVSTVDEVMNMINMGLRVRATHETKMNAFSSRSHTVFMINVLQREKSDDTDFKPEKSSRLSGTFSMVDLAGSERIKKSESQGVRLKEALHINISLTALGKVIMALESSSSSGVGGGGHHEHIPYRDSKLTRILQNSLGGNSFTTVLAMLHPHPTYYEECLSTLQFANRCRNVRNNPRVNYLEENEDKDRKIRRLQEEIQMLRLKVNKLENLASSGKGGGGGSAISSYMLPYKMVELMKKFGYDAEISADGFLVMEGKKISLGEVDATLSLGGEGSLVSSPSKSGPNLLDEGSFSVNGESSAIKKKPPTLQSTAKLAIATKSSLNDSRQKVNEDRMRRLVHDLQESNNKLNTKLKERKGIVEEQAKQIQDLSAELTRETISSKQRESELKQQMKSREFVLQEKNTQLQNKHQEDLNIFIHHNKEILLDHHMVLKSIPECLKVASDLAKDTREFKETFQGVMKEKFESYLKKIEENREVEKTRLKEQYEFWIGERDKQLQEFVDKFNEFRAKKKEQLKMCESEIISLFGYLEQMENLLDQVERGQVPIRQLQGSGQGRTTTGVVTPLHFPPPSTQIGVSTGFPPMNMNNGNGNPTTMRSPRGGGGTDLMASTGYPEAMFNPMQGTRTGNGNMNGEFGTGAQFLLSKSKRPINPLKTSYVTPAGGALSLTRKLVEKHREKLAKQEQIKEEAFQMFVLHATNQATQPSSSSSGSQIIGTTSTQAVDPEIIKQVRELLKNGNGNGAGPGPESSGNNSPRSKPNSTNTNVYEQNVGPPKQSRPSSANRTSSSRNATLSSPRVLHGTIPVSTMPQYPILGSQNVVPPQLPTDLDAGRLLEIINNNETLTYVKELEEEQQKLLQKNRDLQIQLQQLRVANSALTRKNDKERK